MEKKASRISRIAKWLHLTCFPQKGKRGCFIPYPFRNPQKLRLCITLLALLVSLNPNTQKSARKLPMRPTILGIIPKLALRHRIPLFPRQPRTRTTTTTRQLSVAARHVKRGARPAVTCVCVFFLAVVPDGGTLVVHVCVGTAGGGSALVVEVVEAVVGAAVVG